MKPPVCLLFAVLFLLPLALRAQSLPGMPAAPTTLDDRREALAQVEHDYWEDVLKHTPELASALGDTRYNDQVSDYTAAAYNDRQSREQSYLMQAAVIDPSGLSGSEKALLDELQQRLEQDAKDADQMPWQTPIASDGGFYDVYPRLAAELPFATVKDYDDWTARLHALPEAVAQAMESMSLGIDNGRVAPRELVDKALAEVDSLAHQKPEDSPLAAPLRSFPANIGAQEQAEIREEMLGTIEKEVEPAYLRLELFLKAGYASAAGKGPAPAATREERLLFAALDLRARAEKVLGANFDAKAFRDEFLSVGLLPIDGVRARANAWIDAGGKVQP